MGRDRLDLFKFVVGKVSSRNLFDIRPFWAELQKRANRANQLVLFFLAGANFWEKHAKNMRKQAKTGEKQALFWC